MPERVGTDEAETYGIPRQLSTLRVGRHELPPPYPGFPQTMAYTFTLSDAHLRV